MASGRDPPRVTAPGSDGHCRPMTPGTFQGPAQSREGSEAELPWGWGDFPPPAGSSGEYGLSQTHTTAFRDWTALFQRP